MNTLKSFPSYMTPENLGSFKLYEKRRKMSYIRTYIFESMLSDEFNIPKNCGINLQNIKMGNFSDTNFTVDKELIEPLCTELNELGWETFLGYGGTMLFVYTEDNKPDDIVECH